MRKKIMLKGAVSGENGIAFFHGCKQKVTTAKFERGEVQLETMDKKKFIVQNWKELLKCIFFALPMIGIYVLIYNECMIFYHYYSYETVNIAVNLVLCPIFGLGSFFIRVYCFKSDVFRYHSAEHQVFNAYNALGRVPDINEIKMFSNFHRNCGTNSITRMIIISLFFELLICLVCLDTPIEVLYIIVIGFVLTFGYLDKKGKLNFLQYFVTLPPTDKELNLAIKGLSKVIEYENENIFSSATNQKK